MRSLAAVAVLLAVATPGPGRAGVITFETTPAGMTPVDNAPLSGSYMIDDVTVSFGMLVDGNAVTPVFEMIGPPGFDTAADGGFGFVNNLLTELDTAQAGFEAQLGSWFLRTPFLSTTSSVVFTVFYDSIAGPVTAASGEVWDIDAPSVPLYEQWKAEAFNGANMLLGTSTSPAGIFDPNDPASLDARPWVFAFTGLTDIRKVVISHIGTRPDRIGLAFNNYSPVTVAPETGSLALLGSALLLLGTLRRSRL
jgi:hypothetical protein